MKSKKSKISNKKPRITKKQAVASARHMKLLVYATGIAIALVLLIYTIQQKPIQGSSLPILGNSAYQNQDQEQINAALLASRSGPVGKPVNLSIPKIKVNAAIESVGLTSKGAVGAPKGPAKTAWYNLGPRPGNNGNAVITGHYGLWKNGMRSVFDNLYKLRKGDKIYVKDDKGVTISFVVREIRTYDPKANASEVFISTDGKSHLNLITCQGFWNKITKSYSKRLVVFADRE